MMSLSTLRGIACCAPDGCKTQHAHIVCSRPQFQETAAILGHMKDLECRHESTES